MATKPPGILFYFLLWEAIYNAGVMLGIGQLSDAGARRLALAVTLIDEVGSYFFMSLMATAIPQGGQVAFYLFGTIEGVAFFGLAGAVLCTATFIALSAVDLVYQAMVGLSYPMAGMIGKILIVGLAASSLVAVNRILTTPEGSIDPAAALRLSRREQEVLRLVAEGYSNTMIASRLNLSDNTVKGYVENLLSHLNARNRAEAVAAASRLKLI